MEFCDWIANEKDQTLYSLKMPVRIAGCEGLQIGSVIYSFLRGWNSGFPQQ